MIPRQVGDAWLVDIDPSWPGFAGHFPGNPLVPAAEIVAWALAIAAAPGARLGRARFLHPLRPGEQVRLTVASRADGAGVRVERGDDVVAEISLLFRAEA